MNQLFLTLRTAWSLVWGLAWVAALHPLWRTRRADSLWVIGGHRGRIYGDNSAAVEAEARRQGKSIVWIANGALARQLKEQGVSVLERQSFAARRTISRASLLIYSHGEDDLDLQLILLRGRTATRAYLDHCMCTLKAGGMTEPSLLRAPAPVRAFRSWLLTRWDYVLCASEEVRRNFALAYPMNPLTPDRARLHGGAHLDAWQKGLDEQPHKRIYWFPTFRETTSARQRLDHIIQSVTENARLRTWLTNSGYELWIGAHINDSRPVPKLSAPFRFAGLATLTEDVRGSELLISDYSGIVYDFLLLERPQILFAFDLDDYQKRRHLFGDYRARDFALHPRTVDELVELLVSESFRAEDLTKKAKAHRELSLPPKAESYARLSVLELESIEAHSH